MARCWRGPAIFTNVVPACEPDGPEMFEALHAMVLNGSERIGRGRAPRLSGHWIPLSSMSSTGQVGAGFSLHWETVRLKMSSSLAKSASLA